jgi:hypothetical protein
MSADSLTYKRIFLNTFPGAMAAAAAETQMGDGAPPPGALYSFGTPWPELNQGLTYTDTFRCAGLPPYLLSSGLLFCTCSDYLQADADAATTLIEFYSTNHKSSAPLPGQVPICYA